MSLTSIHRKRSLRFVNWRLFLSKFANIIEIKYKPGKTYHNANGLLCIVIFISTSKIAHNIRKDDPIFIYYTECFPVTTRSVKKTVIEKPSNAEKSIITKKLVTTKKPITAKKIIDFIFKSQ